MLGFPMNIPATAAAIEFKAMNTTALRSARVIISLLPLNYLPEDHARQNTVYIPPPLSLSETSVSLSSSRNESSLRAEQLGVAFMFGYSDLSIKGTGGQS